MGSKKQGSTRSKAEQSVGDAGILAKLLRECDVDMPAVTDGGISGEQLYDIQALNGLDFEAGVAGAANGSVAPWEHVKFLADQVSSRIIAWSFTTKPVGKVDDEYTRARKLEAMRILGLVQFVENGALGDKQNMETIEAMLHARKSVIEDAAIIVLGCAWSLRKEAVHERYAVAEILELHTRALARQLLFIGGCETMDGAYDHEVGLATVRAFIQAMTPFGAPKSGPVHRLTRKAG